MGSRQRHDLTHPDRRPVRVRLPELPAPLRAMARPSVDGPGMVLEAELPWLRLGSPVFAQFDPGHTLNAEIYAVDVTVTRDGLARLRIHVTGDGLPELATPREEPLPPPPRRRIPLRIAATIAVAMLALLPLFAKRPAKAALLASTEAPLMARVVKPTRVSIPHVQPDIVDVVSSADSPAPAQKKTGLKVPRWAKRK